MEDRTLSNRAQRAPRGGQDAPKNEKEDRTNINHPRLVRDRHVLSKKKGQHGSNLVSEIEGKSKKIDAKIDRKSDASWNRFLEDFLKIFGEKMKACWFQNRTKIDPNFEQRFFEEN